MKNMYKKLVCFLLVALLIIGITPLSSAETIEPPPKITSSDGNWIIMPVDVSLQALYTHSMFYSRKDNEAILYRYLGNDINVEIPKYIDGYSITKIYDYCFNGIAENESVYSIEDNYNHDNNDRIISVTIPSTINLIGGWAFGSMDSLEEIKFDDSFTGRLDIDNCAFKNSPFLQRLYIPEYCEFDDSNSLWGSFISELKTPTVKNSSSNRAMPLERVEKLTITDNYTFGICKGVFCPHYSQNYLQTVEFEGFVTGDTVESDFKFINGNSINKPDLIFHHIPSFKVETELLELGYVKNYDYETGFTTYSVNGTLDTSYTPKTNNNGVVNELQSGSFKYGLTNSGNAVITGYSGNENSISFPAEIDGYTVTALGDNVNAINIGKAVTIIVPDTVEYIAKNALPAINTLRMLTLQII